MTGYDETNYDRDRNRVDQYWLLGAVAGYDETNYDTDRNRVGQYWLLGAVAGYDVTSCVAQTRERAGQLSMFGQLIRNWSLTSCQQHRVTLGRSNIAINRYTFHKSVNPATAKSQQHGG